jgi:hypothetical protein
MRMSRLLLPACLVAFLLAPATSRAADEPLDPVAWLVGGTWVAEIAPPKGDPLTVLMTVEWAAHKQSVHYTIVFKGKDSSVTQYDGTYYWHPGAKEIRMLQVDRGGQVTEGVTTLADGKWTQKNTLTRKDGTKQEQRTELTRDGDDAFHFRALVPKGDEGVEGLKITYKRTNDAPAKK